MKIHVQDMHCGGCVRGVTAAIKALDAGATVEADLDARDIEVATTAARAEIDAALVKAGFTPS